MWTKRNTNYLWSWTEKKHYMRFQDILQCCSNPDCMTLAIKQIHGPMEQNINCRNKFTHLQSTYLWQRSLKYTYRKDSVVLRKLNIHILLPTARSNQLKVDFKKCVPKACNCENVGRNNRISTSKHWHKQSFYFFYKALTSKKTKKTWTYDLSNICLKNKANSHQSEETANRMAEYSSNRGLICRIHEEWKKNATAKVEFSQEMVRHLKTLLKRRNANA